MANKRAVTFPGLESQILIKAFSRQGFGMESFVIDRSLLDDSGESVDILSSSILSLHGLALGILASSPMTLLPGNWWAL